jgi:hypothetical protein
LNIKIQERVKNLPININIRPKRKVHGAWSQRPAEEQWNMSAPPSLRRRAAALKAKADQRMREEGWQYPYNWRRNPWRRWGSLSYCRCR